MASFSADFLQIFQSHHERLEERGRLLMKKPGRMYWEYESPTKKLFVADGRKAYFYVPEERQVFVSDLNLSTAETPLLFLLGKGDVRADFEVSLETEEDSLQPDNVLLRLEPKRPTGQFSKVLVEVEPATSLIHRLSIVEPIGQRNDYILSNFSENVRVSDRRFRFKIPAGTEVIQQ